MSRRDGAHFSPCIELRRRELERRGLDVCRRGPFHVIEARVEAPLGQHVETYPRRARVVEDRVDRANGRAAGERLPPHDRLELGPHHDQHRVEDLAGRPVVVIEPLHELLPRVRRQLGGEREAAHSLERLLAQLEARLVLELLLHPLLDGAERRVGVYEVEEEAMLYHLERLDQRALEVVVPFARELLVRIRRSHRLPVAHPR
mmetsp:Transcript_49344/g.145667  ORF Transcript_49344/g.145667 Transcript_49344/m.145667 type:complete len:203 (-) Transcript_49344:215-823(-)|eukprot:3223645-Prymnesium_polylepis.1